MKHGTQEPITMITGGSMENTKKCRNCERNINSDKIRCNGCHESYLEGRQDGEIIVKSKIAEMIVYVQEL